MTKSELWAAFGLNRPPKPRYEGLKGIYWYVLSRFVRLRDFQMYNRCISCNKWVESWEQLQGGHFIAAGTGGIELLFDPLNVNGECGPCNGFDGNHLIGYAAGLDERYGIGTAQALRDRYLNQKKVGAPTQKAWSDEIYREKIRYLQAELVLLNDNETVNV